VILVQAGRSKIPLIKAIRTETGLGLKESKAIADAGGPVADGLTNDQAEALLQKLAKAGAYAQLVDRAATPAWERVDSPNATPGSSWSGADVTSQSLADEIRKLADLHAAGVLTEDEFQAAKRRVLGI
jgi:hypothetical protein